MRTFIAVSRTIVLLVSIGILPSAMAQQTIIKQPVPVAVPPPNQIAVPLDRTAVTRPPATVPFGSATPEQPRPLQEAPPPLSFVAPGIEGIYATLRNAKAPPPLKRQLRPYEPYQSPATPPDASKFNLRQVVVKFVEGTSVRFRDGVLVVSEEPAALETSARLARASLDPPSVQKDLGAFNDQIRSFGGFVGRASPNVDELDLLRLRQAAERNTGLEQPDLNLFYFVYLPDLKPEDAQRALATLMKHPIIEAAYFQPIPFNSVDKPPQTMIDVTSSQGYFMAAPSGIDVNFARNFAGGRGDGVRIADVEAGWNTNHEDLPQMAFGFGVNWGDQHGTAVLGEIVAAENSFGATGIAPNAMVGFSSVTNLNPLQPIYFYSVASAVLMAGHALRFGDIVLIEQHFPNPFAGPCPSTCSSNCAQFGYVAVETIPFEHAAISLMTGAGVVVVEAAGNGVTLVTPASPRDSGAIVVGASDTKLVPECWSNFGPRVNVHAWGEAIGTLGYGGIANGPAIATLRANGADADQWYTRTFGGTSGASPIVVGAATLIQSTRMATNLAPLSPIAMRSLLVSTGTPQAPGSMPNIGPLPNLRAAIATYNPDSAAFVDQTAAPGGAIAPGTQFTVMERFRNSGGVSWFGAYTLAVAPSQSGAATFGTQSFTLASPQAPINPGQIVAPTFNIQAPAQPGSYRLGFVLRNPAGQVMAVSPEQQITVAIQTGTGPGPYDATNLTLASAPGPFKVGLPGIVIVTALNTGTTTWTPSGYGLRISGSSGMTVPQGFKQLGTTVPPGQSRTFTVDLQCRIPGFASFSTQMSGPSSAFGPSVAQNVSCQP